MRIDKSSNKNASSLILFFAGWSASPESFRSLKIPDGTDLWICYDYRSLDFQEDLSPYTHIHLIAWSLGVWVADFLFQEDPVFDTATAINGTPLPVDDRYGIPPSIFKGTLANITEQGITRFNRRMCGSRQAWEDYSQTAIRPLAELEEELRYLYHRIISSPACTRPSDTPLWTRAYIGSEDRIFPADNLRRYWQEPVSVIEIEAPHYLFSHYQTWNELWN